MAKIVGSAGSGITEQAVVKFEVATDLKEIVAAANHSMMLESFASIQKMIGDTAKSVLSACELPTDLRGSYAYKAGSWAQLEANSSPPGHYENFVRLLTLLGIKPDTAPGYAARALILIDQIALLIPRDPDRAQAMIYELGGLIREATLKSAWEEDALRGEKIQRSAEAGGAAAHGSKEFRARQNEALKQEVQRLVEAGTKPMEAYRKIGKRLGVDPKTVQRRIRRK